MLFSKLPPAAIRLFGLAVLIGLIACQQTPLDLDPVPSLPTDLDVESTADDAVTEENTETPSLPRTEENRPVVDPTGRIAFINLAGELATVNPDGSEERILSEEGTFFRFPAWSPTTNKIAAIGFSEDSSGVFVFSDSEGGEQVSIYEDDTNAPIYLYWFPEGGQVSFIAPSAGTSGLALHLVPADGSDEGSILATGQPLYWQWLKNNRQALIHAGSDRLSFLDLEGNESETGLGIEGFFQAPAISFTNRYFAYQEVRPDGRVLQVKDILEDEVIHEQPHEGILTMAWSPDELQLVYVNPEDRGGFVGPLISFDVTTGESKTIVPHNVLTFFWSPDGRYIAFLTPDELSRQTWLPDPIWVRTAQPIQESRSLALGFIDLESGSVNYISDFVPTPLFIRQFIPFFDQYALSHRIWSPDSQFIVLPVMNEEDNRPVIRVFATDGRLPVTIASGISAFWSHE